MCAIRRTRTACSAYAPYTTRTTHATCAVRCLGNDWQDAIENISVLLFSLQLPTISKLAIQAVPVGGAWYGTLHALCALYVICVHTRGHVCPTCIVYDVCTYTQAVAVGGGTSGLLCTVYFVYYGFYLYCMYMYIMLLCTPRRSR